MAAISKTQIDRLGDRLKKGNASDGDLLQLDIYRESFAETLRIATDIIREQFNMQPAARIKVTRSIVEKLRRGSTKLSQMQDIAGCRVIVEDIIAQENAVEALRCAFADVKIVDRRLKCSPKTGRGIKVDSLA